MSALIKGTVTVADIGAAAGAGLWVGQTGTLKLPLSPAGAKPSKVTRPIDSDSWKRCEPDRSLSKELLADVNTAAPIACHPTEKDDVD